MNRRSFLVAAPQVLLAATCVFGAARVSTSRPADAPPCGGADGADGTRESQPAEPPGPAATHEPEAAPRRVQPLPLPAEDDRSWLQEWLDLVARTTGEAALGC
jgi:hypothetical protein